MQVGLKGRRKNLLQGKKFNNKASNSRLVARANPNDIALDQKSKGALHSIVNKGKFKKLLFTSNMVVIMNANNKKVSLGCPDKFMATEDKLGSTICIDKECEADDDYNDDDASKIAPAA
ncbi:hypothetical protein MTR67_022953 [Solanum verrucosum]|uniref:Uncharacterized protein n=1 Tax=Solanum verrucosum TaxID=315347 RepID=A0AAF0QW88_SOLVR|nr:hypothetical protein MTR67_022953 [Solanum verrucosum]